MANQKRPAGSRPGQGGRTTQVAKAPSRTAAAAQGAGPRRLGGQTPASARSAGAARRYDRSRKKGSSRYGWGAVGVVVVVIAAFLAIHFSSGNSPSSSGSSGVASGNHPAAASAALVSAMATIPVSAFDAVGTDGQPAAFTVTKDQPPLTSGGKPEFVYVGGEFCPYCALGRWSFVSALSRFGTFTNLKITSSDNAEGDIPTFSFLGSTYKSQYLVFSPWETEDRNQAPLQTPPTYVNDLYAKYDGTGNTGTVFSPGGAGIPFLDIGNKYVSSGDPSALAATWSQGILNNGGPGRDAIAAALHDPTSANSKALNAPLFIAQANYISAAICDVDGNQPAGVCTSSGVKAAAKVLAAAKTVS